LEDRMIMPAPQRISKKCVHNSYRTIAENKSYAMENSTFW
jgi:hypothetical protein